MCYLRETGYKNDVFVSYAHVDNEPILGQEKGWVLNFISDLEKTLARKLGNAKGQCPFIWMDHELAYNKPLDEALVAELRQTATFLIIMSNAYLVSDWCREERAEFFKVINSNPSSTKVFIVEIDELDRGKYPTDINKNLIPYKFWSKEKDSKARTLGIPDRNTEDYFKRLLDIGADLANELTAIKASSNAINPVFKTQESVFLAQVTDDLDDQREEVKRYLKDAGYRILPEESWLLSDDTNKLKKIISDNLVQCKAYVQLLSNLAGKKLPNSDQGITKLQFEIAKDSSNKMMIWRSPDLNLEDVKDQNLKAILESEYVRSECLEEFKAAIIKNMEEPKKRLPINHNESSLVYLCADSVDMPYCKDVILKEINRLNALEELNKKIIDVSLPLVSNDPAKVRKYQEQNLLQCDATVFVYCNSDPDIIFNQIMHCRKINIRREEPFKVVAIYDGPPPEKEGIEINLPSIQLSYLNCRESLDEFIEKFLKVLAKS
jgi:hypothetical protein